MNNLIAVTCECGNKLDVEIIPRLRATAHPEDPKKYTTLMGTKICPKCGKEIWVRGYIEMVEPQE